MNGADDPIDEAGTGAQPAPVDAPAPPPAPAPLPPLTRAELERRLALARDVRRSETLEVAELGGTVTVREVPARMREDFEDALNGEGAYKGTSLVRRMAYLFALAAVDAEGAPLFRAEDEPLLAELPARVLHPIWRAIARVNALGVRGVASRLGESEAGRAGVSSSG